MNSHQERARIAGADVVDKATTSKTRIYVQIRRCRRTGDSRHGAGSDVVNFGCTTCERGEHEQKNELESVELAACKTLGSA